VSPLRKLLEPAEKLLSPHVKRGMTVLDLGCGTGVLGIGALLLGAKVYFVESDGSALEIARNNPSKQVVFFAVGFETTAPATAVVIKEAEAQGIDNFCITFLSNF